MDMLAAMTDERARHDFVDRMGDLGATSGMPRMAARMLAYLMTVDDGRATAAELSQALAVSPAAVSGAMRYLEHTDLIRRTRARGDRRDVFVVEVGSWVEYTLHGLDVMRVWSEVFSDGAEALSAGPGRDRLVESAELFAFLKSELDASMQLWRHNKQLHHPSPTKRAALPD